MNFDEINTFPFTFTLTLHFHFHFGNVEFRPPPPENYGSVYFEVFISLAAAAAGIRPLNQN